MGNKYSHKLIFATILMIFILTLLSCQRHMEGLDNQENLFVEENEIEISENYNILEEVALYIHNKGKLPNYYLTKKEALALGWEANKGNLWDISKGAVIGGDPFYNREELLPQKQGRNYFEADVNYRGGFRNAERIVFSDDGLIYYTKDHYETFELLFGDD